MKNSIIIFLFSLLLFFIKEYIVAKADLRFLLLESKKGNYVEYYKIEKIASRNRVNLMEE
jgi:hypothetical protein